MLLIHETNMDKKIRERKGLSEELQKFKDEFYKPFQNEMMAIDYAKKNEEDFKKAAQLLTDYYKKAQEFASENSITSQSKFVSSILEEISTYLFNKLLEGTEFKEYNNKVFAGLVFDEKDEIVLNEKNVDYCVGKELDIKVSTQKRKDKKLTIKKPIIAVEVKTYMDATMFSGIRTFSADLKRGSMECKTYVLMAYKNIDDAHIRYAKGTTELDEIFVLCANDECVFDGNALLEYYNEIEKAIKNYGVVTPIRTTGRLLNN